MLRTIVHLADAHAALPRAPRRAPPRLLVTGLNPHAGEGGLFGDDEPRAIAPAIAAGARAAAVSRRAACGSRARSAPRPRSARPPGSARDAVVAMMHDQATIASKLLDWTQAVNVTWGLPFVRTSVDHGVAYDAAGAGRRR